MTSNRSLLEIPMSTPSQTPASGEPSPVRLLICDDQNLVRACLCKILKDFSSIKVIGEASSGKMAVELALELQPDVVLMDISMPDLNGIEATRQILRQSPGIRIIAFSTESSSETILEALDAGAGGYLLKTGDPSQIMEAVEKVVRGEPFINVRGAKPNFPGPDSDDYPRT